MHGRCSAVCGERRMVEGCACGRPETCSAESYLLEPLCRLSRDELHRRSIKNISARSTCSRPGRSPQLMGSLQACQSKSACSLAALFRDLSDLEWGRTAEGNHTAQPVHVLPQVTAVTVRRKAYIQALQSTVQCRDRTITSRSPCPLRPHNINQRPLRWTSLLRSTLRKSRSSQHPKSTTPTCRLKAP